MKKLIRYQWNLAVLMAALFALQPACGPLKIQPLTGNSPNSDVSIPSPGGDENQPFFETTPLWEPRISGSDDWTAGTMNTILKYAPNLLAGSDDIQELCPSYVTLSKENRAGFLTFFISAIARYESGFKTTTRFHEDSMGMDAVTGLPVYSEGLLQLSYQDTQWATFCEFDWNRDKKLSPTDPRKTIFDPIKNLSCGIRILDRQVERKGRLMIGSGAYWAVIKTDAGHNKIREIKALTRDLPVCQI